jgi:hypothetical protein
VSTLDTSADTGDAALKQAGSRDCLIVPVHPPKSNWLFCFLGSVERTTRVASKPFDIVVVASNYQDYCFFVRLLSIMPCRGLVRVVCIDQYIGDTLGYETLLGRYRVNQDRCIVNLKKFMAMHWAVANGYDRIACVDCDILAVEDLQPLFDDLSENYGSGLYFGQSSVTDETILRIIRECRLLLPDADQQRIAELTKGDTVYPWFFDAPFYTADDLRAFFAEMATGHESLEGWLCRIDYHGFEHLVFLLWRCGKGVGTLIDMADMGIASIGEYMRFHELTRIQNKYGYCPVWDYASEAFGQPELLKTLPKIRLLCHFDRL